MSHRIGDDLSKLHECRAVAFLGNAGQSLPHGALLMLVPWILVAQAAF